MSLEKLKNSKFVQWTQKPKVNRFLNQWELDLCVIFFLFETVLQTIQVITRYVFKYSFVVSSVSFGKPNVCRKKRIRAIKSFALFCNKLAVS